MHSVRKKLFRWLPKPVLLFLPIALVGLMLPLVSPLMPTAHAADTFYSFTDNTYQDITGPEPGGSDVLTWSRSANGRFVEPNSLSTIVMDDGQNNAGTAVIEDVTGGTQIPITVEDYTQTTPPPTGNPTKTAKWIDHNTLLIDGKTYFDSKTDDTQKYTVIGAIDACEAKNTVEGFDHGGGNPASATDSVTLTLYHTIGGGNNSCATPETFDLTFTDTAKYSYYFSWQDSATITTSDQSGTIYRQDASATTQFLDDGTGRSHDSTCQSTITASPGAASGTIILRVGNDNHALNGPFLLNEGWPPEISGASYTLQGSCRVSSPINIKIENTNAGKPPGSYVPGQAGGNGGAIHDNNATCEASVGNPLTWMLCPVFNGIADTADWLFNNLVQPFLYTSPINTDPSSGSFQIWSNFRVYGNIILIIALLVIVLGQSFGGGIVDAYTARKVLPRILVAAILINLSVYIVNFMVDVTNILGGGIGNLLLQPLKDTGELSFGPNGFASLGIVLSSGLLALFAGGAAFTGIIGAIFFGQGAFIAKAAIFIGLAVVIPIVLALLGVFVTLILRNGIILFLILISPVAFALYCLPNTQQYFKKWWDLLFKTLLVYPIVIVVFAVADILAVTVMNANGINGADNAQIQAALISAPLAAAVAFFLQFIPLFMIPFAFKFAGGAIGAVHAAVSGQGGKVQGLFKKRKEQYRKDTGRMMTQARGNTYSRLGARADSATGGRKSAYNFLRKRVGGYNMHAEMAAYTADQAKEFEAQKDTGIDDEQRAFTVNKEWALQHDTAGGTHWRMNADGQREFRTLGGRWVAESNVDAAHSRWDGNQDFAKASLAYEMQKATTQEEQDYLVQNYGRMGEAGSGVRMNAGEMAGTWTAAAFMKQNTDRQWKHHYWDQDSGTLKVSGVNLMREIDERQGSWQMSSQSADTWTTMSQEVQRARQVQATGVADGEMDVAAAQEVMQRSARIARSMQGGYQDESGNYHSSIGQGASGRTKEEMENFAALFTPTDYTREVGLERRAVETVNPATGARTPARSGDTPNPAIGPPDTQPRVPRSNPNPRDERE